MTDERDILQYIIQDQLRRHPGFRIDDLYKMLHQVCYGGAHLLKNKAKARKTLLEEWDNTEKIPKGEPLIETIDPRSEVMRINLRIYKKIGGTPQRLFDVFVRSAEKVKPDRERLILYWNYTMDMIRAGDIPFSKDLMEDFWIDVGKDGFPSIHHSESYVDANRPSYRVVMKHLWEGFEEEE